MSEPLSFTNPQVQRLRRLLGRRSARSAEGRFVLHGATAVREAEAAGWSIEVEFVGAGSEPVSRASWRELGPGVLERVADAASPQPHLAIVEMPEPALELGRYQFVVVLDRINDPGNLGTIMRSCEAAGVEALVLTPGSVDPFNPKVVRSAAGALLRLPVTTAEITDVANAGFRLVGTSSHGGRSHTEFDWQGRVAVVMGNEAHGLDEHAPIDDWVQIVHRGRAESLNVAMATTLLVFQAMERRFNTA